MARRLNAPDLARATRPPAVARRLVPALALATTLALSACSVTFNPGPGEAAFEASRWQVGEAAEPVHNTVASGARSDTESGSESGYGTENRSAEGGGASVADGVESGTIEVKPAPQKSPDDEGDAGSSSDTDGDAGGGTAGNDGGSGTGNGGGAGNGEGGAEPDLSDAVQYARALEAEVNQRREAHGLPALTHDDCAYDEALERAEALRGRDLEHAPLESIFDRCPTSTVGENLARGGWSPAEAADGWMNSEGHRANILNAAFTRGAIACISEDTTYGQQMTCAHVFLG